MPLTAQLVLRIHLANTKSQWCMGHFRPYVVLAMSIVTAAHCYNDVESRVDMPTEFRMIM